MKNQYDGKVVWISELQVMQSAAGYYLGTSCLTLEYPDNIAKPILLDQPHDRQTGYMASEEEANALLAEWKASEDIDPD